MDILGGLCIGILLGCLGMWILNRSHQKTVRKLIESRSKLERQRTQAVNDFFELRSQVENNSLSGTHPAINVEPSQEPKVAAEVANLKNLLVRADAALAVARRKRSEYEEEIARLRSQLGQGDAEVINLHQDRPAVGG